MASVGIGVSSVGQYSGPPWTPLEISPTQWFRSDLGITLSGSDVTSWTDQEGTQDISGAAAPPSYDTGGALPKLVFAAASQERLTHVDLAKPSAYHVSLVLKMGALYASRYLWAQNTGSGAYLLFTADPKVQIVHPAVGSLTGPSMPSVLCHLEFGWTGTVLRARINGAAWSQTNIASLGGVYGGTTSLSSPSGVLPVDIDELYEYGYWASTPSDVALATMRLYVSSRYGV